MLFKATSSPANKLFSSIIEPVISVNNFNTVYLSMSKAAIFTFKISCILSAHQANLL